MLFRAKKRSKIAAGQAGALAPADPRRKKNATLRQRSSIRPLSGDHPPRSAAGSQSAIWGKNITSSMAKICISMNGQSAL